MLYSITATNNLNESVELELARPELSGFIVKNVSGLGTGKANVNSVDTQVSDVSTFVSARLNKRNIVLSLEFCDENYTIEEIREKCYKYFPCKQSITLTFKSDDKTVYINGYVESNEPIIFSERQSTQISILCLDPYFKDISTAVCTMSLVEPLLEFPLTFDPINGNMLSNRNGSVFRIIENKSSVDVYPVVTFTALSTVVNPSLMNIHTYEKMLINTTLQAGDRIVVDSRLGTKSVTKFSGYNDVGVNIFNLVSDEFEFFPLHVGSNKLKFDADENADGLMIQLSFEILYGGL